METGREPEHTSPGKTEGKKPCAGSVTRAANIRLVQCSLRSQRQEPASEADRKAGYAQGERRISDAGICLIKQFEGWPSGGRTAARQGSPPLDMGIRPGVAMGMKITQAQAEAYFEGGPKGL